MRALYDGVGNVTYVDTNEQGDLFGLKCEDPSLAVQDAKDECDINTIVRRFGLTGQIPVGAVIPNWGEDYLDAPTEYRQAVEMVRDAEESFRRLPAAVRASFNNDPGAFVTFASDPANISELKKMGLGLDKPKIDDIVTPKPEGSPQA